MKKALSVLAGAVLAATHCSCSNVTTQPSANNTQVSFTKANVASNYIKGADISELLEMEQKGIVYKDQNGVATDALKILKDNGVNYVRIRLWNDPKDANGKEYGAGNDDLATVTKLAKRAKDLGMKFLLDFHYSDFWTDPGKQFKPKAWENLSYEELQVAIHDYTRDVIKSLKAAGCMPDMVQVGNEITGGFLWPTGKSWGIDTPQQEFDRLSTLLKSAIKGLDEAKGDSEVKVMLHLDKGTKKDQYKWWFDEITKRNVPFDVIGMSLYPFWDGPIDNCIENIKFVKQTYGKDVIIAEASWPYTTENDDRVPNSPSEAEALIGGYNPTVEGQYSFLKDTMEKTEQAGAYGIFYWGTTWKAGPGITWATQAGIDYIKDKCGTSCPPGNSRENHALFDKEGKVLPSIKVFNN